MTDPATDRPLRRARPRRNLRLPLDTARYVAAVVLSYALVGLVLGWVWFLVWSPEDGTVFNKGWYASSDALRGDFSGTGLYVLVAAGGGLVLGLVAAFLGGARPLVTVVAALAGAVVAGYLMVVVGEWLGPADPAVLARTAHEGATLPSSLRVSGSTPFLAFPTGTLAALAAVFTLLPGRGGAPWSRTSAPTGKSPDPPWGAEPRG